MATPGKLYKYQAIDNRAKPEESRSLENLRKSQIWLTNPAYFNDPFDCTIHFKLSETSDTDWRLVGSFFRNDKELQAKVKSGEIVPNLHFDENDRPDERSKKIIIEKIDLFDQGWIESQMRYGVACFTTEYNNILMWSHYANKHQGFCLEFDTKYDPLQRAEKYKIIYKVRYSDSYPVIDLVEVFGMREQNINHPEILQTTKSSCWSYEQEYRLLSIFHNNCGLKYPPEALTSVYFGWKMSPEDKALIEKTLADAGFTGTKYQMRRSETEFRVEAEQIT